MNLQYVTVSKLRHGDDYQYDVQEIGMEISRFIRMS